MESKGGEFDEKALFDAWAWVRTKPKIRVRNDTILGNIASDYIDDILVEGYRKGYAAAKAESKWISVKERLPEKLALVMLCDKDGEYWWGYYGHDLRWHYNFGDGIKEGKEFTDWQPLPPPPEAK